MSMLFENPLYLMMLVIAIACAGSLLAYAKFGSGIKNRLKGPEKSPVLILTKAPPVQDTKLLIDGIFYLSAPKTEEAWVLHPNAQQYYGDGTLAGLLLTHDTSLPEFTDPSIEIERMYEAFEKAVAPLASSQFHQCVETEVAKNSNSALAEWLGFGVVVAIGGVLVVVIGIMIASRF